MVLMTQQNPLRVNVLYHCCYYLTHGLYKVPVVSGADNRGNKACLALGIANTVTNFQHSQGPTEQAGWSKQVHGQEAPTANRQCWQPDATANTLTHTGLRDDKRASLALHLWVGGPPEAGDRQVFPLYVLLKLARVASRSQG